MRTLRGVPGEAVIWRLAGSVSLINEFDMFYCTSTFTADSAAKV
jgi:hypothetical protein